MLRWSIVLTRLARVKNKSERLVFALIPNKIIEAFKWCGHIQRRDEIKNCYQPLIQGNRPRPRNVQCEEYNSTTYGHDTFGPRPANAYDRKRLR